MFANQYEEHLAHSAPCSSRWDGFDRGDVETDEVRFFETVIGRMTNNAGQRVVIFEEYADGDLFYRVEVAGNVVFFEEGDRPRAIRVARWWMAGCPA